MNASITFSSGGKVHVDVGDLAQSSDFFFTKFSISDFRSKLNVFRGKELNPNSGGSVLLEFDSDTFSSIDITDGLVTQIITTDGVTHDIAALSTATERLDTIFNLIDSQLG